MTASTDIARSEGLPMTVCLELQAVVLTITAVVVLDRLLAFDLPFGDGFAALPIERTPAPDRLRSTLQQPANTLGQLVAVGGLGGEVVGGVGRLVVVGDDGAHQLGGVAAGSAPQNVQAVGLGASSSYLGMLVAQSM
jgi:hypothetical protein